MNFRFSVDDNIIFLKDITNSSYHSIFENPYLSMYKRLHEKYHAKVQLNLFYQTDDFTLSNMPDRYKSEWIENSSWLQLSFHSRSEIPMPPYKHSGYDEVHHDCRLVHNEIIRFAGEQTLNLYTTIHCCDTTNDGVLALRDAGICGLVGIFGTKENPRDCYGLKYEVYKALYNKPYFFDDNNKMYFFNIDMIVNKVAAEDVEKDLSAHIGKEHIELMIHEQYYYRDYPWYQPDFENKLELAFSYLLNHGYQSVFIDEIITG